MALTLVIAAGAPGGSVVANQPMNFTVTVTNTGTASLSLTALRVGESTSTGARLSQPRYLTPGAAQGSDSYPTIGAGLSASYSFQAVFNAPNFAGPSPTNPGGAAPGQRAEEANAVCRLEAQAQFSDGTAGSTTLTVSALSAVAPFPVPDVGATQFRQGGNSNLIAVLV